MGGTASHCREGRVRQTGRRTCVPAASTSATVTATSTATTCGHRHTQPEGDQGHCCAQPAVLPAEADEKHDYRGGEEEQREGDRGALNPQAAAVRRRPSRNQLARCRCCYRHFRRDMRGVDIRGGYSTSCFGRHRSARERERAVKAIQLSYNCGEAARSTGR